MQLRVGRQNSLCQMTADSVISPPHLQQPHAGQVVPRQAAVRRQPECAHLPLLAICEWHGGGCSDSLAVASVWTGITPGRLPPLHSTRHSSGVSQCSRTIPAVAHSQLADRWVRNTLSVPAGVCSAAQPTPARHGGSRAA